ncbi:GGDEF domain-containing protein [Pseudonocardia sp. TRM90224]|uniref:GGDEF domain-containing protein n=1 Tax=Pseudonocardia sp. TRM90224 TaxID=2812678 RepID=UPI001E3F07C2|nr:GGDEF domain-containing protein [Pseudonocardia sp. TRM90224]
MRAVVGVLVVEGAAIAVIAGEALAAPPTAGFALAAFVALLSIVHTELATGIERIRRRTAETSYFDLSSVWTFAAALLLPPILASAVIIVVYAHLWQRVWRPAKVPLYRHVYTTATVVLAATAAHTAVERAGGLPGDPTDMAGVLGVCAAVVIYVGVNTVLVAAAIALSSTEGVSVRDLIGRLDDNALEIATLCMGALAAVALQATPGLIVMALPPILVLHRAVLVRQLEEEASTDGKTGLLNAAAWQTQAARAVRRVQRGVGGAAVLILDLDHFKHVNDDYGHLAGDDVLVAVASSLQSVVREQDVVGRFGGEEFVVLLPDLPLGPPGRAELAKVAERLRATVARLDVTVDTADGALTITGLSISVGGATVPADGTALDQVLKAADASLYAAKRAGRNLVRIAGAAEIPVQRTGEASRAATS